MITARYVHTNLVAHEWLERGSGVPRAHIRGAHLRLRGHGDEGPTIEIFSYDEVAAQSHPVANRAGCGHVAFAVDDVARLKRWH